MFHRLVVYTILTIQVLTISVVPAFALPMLNMQSVSSELQEMENHIDTDTASQHAQETSTAPPCHDALDHHDDASMAHTSADDCLNCDMTQCEDGHSCSGAPIGHFSKATIPDALFINIYASKRISVLPFLVLNDIYHPPIT